MRTLKMAFTKHPASVGENYFQHLRSAFGFGFSMLFGSLACFIHGLFPFLCEKTGSLVVTKLHRRMVTHRDKSGKKQPPSVESEDRAQSRV